MSFDSEIENTLIEEINHYNRSTVEAHNEYNHIPAALTMKHFLVLKEKLEAVRVNCRSMFLDQYPENKANNICYNKLIRPKCSSAAKIGFKLRLYVTLSVWFWQVESQKTIAILQRWWWLVHEDSQRWMMRLSQWQIASKRIQAAILTECQTRQIDANSFLISSNPDELGIEKDTSGSD